MKTVSIESPKNSGLIFTAVFCPHPEDTENMVEDIEEEYGHRYSVNAWCLCNDTLDYCSGRFLLVENLDAHHATICDLSSFAEIMPSVKAVLAENP